MSNFVELPNRLRGRSMSSATSRRSVFRDRIRVRKSLDGQRSGAIARKPAVKYTVSIIICALLFALLGVLSAWGAAHYQTSGGESRGDRDIASMVFVLLPLGGTVVGIAVGYVAAYLGKRYTDPPGPTEE